MASGRPAPFPHTKRCRERMEAHIQVDEPARWKKAMLGKRMDPKRDSADRSDSDGEGVPPGSACAPGGAPPEEQPVRAEYAGFRGPMTSLIHSTLKEKSEGGGDVRTACGLIVTNSESVPSEMKGQDELVESLLSVDVVEAYSLPRVTVEANKLD